VHQLITLDTKKHENEITAEGVGVGNVGIVAGLRYFPPTPSIMMNDIAFGNQVILSYLSKDQRSANDK